MTNQEKKELMTGLLQGANLEHAQINLILEEGATISYSCNQPNDNKTTSNSHHTKDAIMDYVGRLKPMVRDSYIDCYDQLWMGILELKEVKMHVYDSGKQQDTTFKDRKSVV